MEAAQARALLLQRESMQLIQYLHRLPREAWSWPSACAQWQIQDVVAHLIGVAEFYTESISRGLRGDTSPPKGLPPAGARNAASAAQGMVQSAIAVREKLGDRLLATFEATDSTLNHLLAHLRPQDWEKPCYHLGGLFPVRWFHAMRCAEIVIHSWDIRSRVSPKAPLSPESLPVLLDVLTTLTPGWAFWPGTSLATPVCYRFVVTGPVRSRIDIVVTGEQARLEEASAEPPAVTFRCATETYVLMRYGRLSLTDALATGQMIAEGNPTLAMAFGQWFRGI